MYIMGRWTFALRPKKDLVVSPDFTLLVALSIFLLMHFHVVYQDNEYLKIVPKILIMCTASAIIPPGKRYKKRTIPSPNPNLHGTKIRTLSLLKYGRQFVEEYFKLTITVMTHSQRINIMDYPRQLLQVTLSDASPI